MATKKKSPRQDELSAEDYAILGAAFTALGDFFALLSLIKQRETTQDEGGGNGGSIMAPGVGPGIGTGVGTAGARNRRR